MQKQVDENILKNNSSLEMFRIGGECYKTFRINFNRDSFRNGAAFEALHLHRVLPFDYEGIFTESFMKVDSSLRTQSIRKKTLFLNKNYIEAAKAETCLLEIKEQIKKEIDKHNALFHVYTEAMVASLEVMNLVYNSYFDQRDYAQVKTELLVQLSAYIPFYAKNKLLSSNKKYLINLSKTISAVAQSEGRPSFTKAQELAVKFLIRLNECYLELLKGKDSEYSFMQLQYEEMDFKPLLERFKSLPTIYKKINGQKSEYYNREKVMDCLWYFRNVRLTPKERELKLRLKKYCNLANFLYEDFHNTNDDIANGYGSHHKYFGAELQQLHAKFAAIENNTLEEYDVEESNYTNLCSVFLYQDEALKEILNEFMVEYHKLAEQGFLTSKPSNLRLKA